MLPSAPSPARRPAAPALLLAALGLLACAGSGAEAGAQAADGAGGGGPNLDRCVAAERYLAESMGMTTAVSPDTLDDWRTDRLLPACRVTAAGSSPLEVDVVAENLYAGLFATGWERTPDPQDGPKEASFRLRRGETDCLFSFYHNTAIGTADEMRVMSALVIPPGEQRYNVLAQCVEALDSNG